MILSNNTIYNYTQSLAKLDLYNIRLPVKIGFFLKKNIALIIKAGQEIEQERIEIAKNFGQLTAEGAEFYVPPENVSLAQKELNDLFNLEQNLNIHIFKLDEFDGIELTYDQMSAIMFMIEE